MPISDTDLLSDWALLQVYLDKRAFIDPFLFNAVRGRGLLGYVNDLGELSPAEAKATVYGRLLRQGKVYGEEQIDELSFHIEETKRLQQRLAGLNPTDVGGIAACAEQLLAHARALAAHFAGDR